MKAIIDEVPHVTGLTGLTGLTRPKPGREASLQWACTERREKCAARRMHASVRPGSMSCVVDNGQTSG
jgi:hypothetical protein